MSHTLLGCVISLLLFCMIYTPLFAFRSACAVAWRLRARLSRWLSVLLPRIRPARLRLAPIVLQRSLCAILIVVMAINPVLASPEMAHSVKYAVSAMAINTGERVNFWWHTSGWAESSARFGREHLPFLRSSAVQQQGWDGIGAPAQPMPKPRPQETQEERNARVVRLEILPAVSTIRPNEAIPIMVIGYDAQNNPIGGLPVELKGWNETSGEAVNGIAQGKFAAGSEGSYMVTASMDGLVAQTKMTVSGSSVTREGQQPIGTRVVSSRDQLPAPKSSSSSSVSSKSRDRIAKNLSSRQEARLAAAGTKAMPRLLPAGDDPYRWNSDNYPTMDDPGKQRGNPAGHSPDGGAGSNNFQFSAPLLNFDGRGLDLNLALNYNSRVWHKANNELTFNIDGDWPGPGWLLGFDKVVSMGGQNGYMLVAADGTRRPYTCSITFYPIDQEAKCKTTDGSFIDYKVIGDSPDRGGAPHTTFVHYPDGTEFIYVSAGSNLGANYPVQIVDANSNRMLISYRNNKGPQIDKITDTLGRVFQFYYDGNNLPVAITAPGHGATPRQTVVRINWEWRNLAADLGANYGFSGVTTKVRSNDIPVIRAIYYPATDTGFWFGNVDSYSKYGMISKVIEQVGMGFSGAPLPADPNQPADPGTITPGTMSRQVVYDYPMVASGLGSEPTYRRMTESWADMDVEPAVTQYLVQENANPRKVEITKPDGVKTVMLSHNAPGQFYDGLIYQDETYSSQGVLLGKSFVQWEQGECPAPGQAAGPYQYCAPRPSRVETTDERNQRTGRELSYGPRYNQLTETREYGYGYTSGGAKTLLRRTVNQYLNDANYNDPQPRNDLVWHHIFNLVTVSEVYAGDGTRLSRTEYFYDQFRGRGGLMDTPGINYGGFEGWSPYTHPNYEIYNLDTRGNLTTIRSYANAATLDPATAVVETRHYDITGNVRQIESSCCEVTTINYTLNTQYAWPESQTRGSASDPAKQNTTAATYDFNTGVVMTATDANGRPSQYFYFDGAPRPRFNYAPTGGYIYHHYDDDRRIVFELAYEAGKSGANIASRVDKYLDGLGRVRKEIAYGKNLVFDVVETKYDQLGRVWQQTRPYRQGSETPQWSTMVYDELDREIQRIAPDGSITNSRYNEGPDPAGSSGQPGQTTLITDPWGRQRWARSDALGRMVEVGEPNPDGDGTLTAGALFTNYSYDALNRLIQVVQGVQTRMFRYDALGRLTHQKLAEKAGTLNDGGQYVGTGTWSDVFSYDTRSNLIQRVDARGVKTLFNYGGDPLNRLQAVQYDKSGVHPSLIGNIPDAPNVSYAYLTTGDKMRVQNVVVASGMGNETMSYDSEGRLSQSTQIFSGRESYPLVTSYLWDTIGRLKEKTYPMQYGAGDVRKKVEPTYDIASRPDSLKFGGMTFASSPVYNAASQTTSLNIGGQIKELYNFDSKTGLLTSQSVERGADRLLNLQYNYTLLNDANNNGAKTGQLTGITDLRNQARNRAYEYDRLGRLKKVKGGASAFLQPAWNQSYSYDRYGNRTSVTKIGDAPQIPRDGLASLSYNTANNRITSAGFEYDTAGNQTKAVVNDNGTQQQYRYDSAGRLAQVLDGSGAIVLATYSYGAGNERLMSVEGGVTKYFAWDGGRIIGEFEAAGASGLQWKTSYVYLGGRLLATTSGINGMETRFHHPERLGTRLVTDAANGEEVTEQLMLPFGTMQPYGGYGGDNSWQHAAKDNPSQKRFTSYDRSDVTGQDYAVNRFYSSAQGRFTQVDLIGMDAVSLEDPQSLNMYAYCDNDPVNITDPSGLFFGKLFKWIGKIFKWIAIAAVVAIAVLTVVPAAWAGTILAKISIWAAKHAILASLLGLHAPQFVIFNLASAAGITTAGFWALAGVGAVNSFLSSQDQVFKTTDPHGLESETVTVREDGTVLYEATMEICGSWRCEFRKMGREIAKGARRGWRNSTSSPGALLGAAISARTPGLKKIPNKYGKKGGPAHQQKVDEVFKDIEDRGLTAKKEIMINTPGGVKGKRFVDVVGKDPATGDIIEMHQVGKQTKGGLPVSREVKALDDIQKATKKRPQFHPYN